MPKAISIHLGVAAVDPDRYAKPPSPLQAPELDAKAMATLADRRHIEVRGPLLGPEATCERLREELGRAREELDAGSLLVLTFAGHGAQLGRRAPAAPAGSSPAGDPVGDDVDRLDESWCLWDGYFLDDELHHELGLFPPGVRILVCSDSCHGGSMLELPARPGLFAREYFNDHARASYTARAGEYGSRRAAVAVRSVARPSVIHLGACLDNEVAFESAEQGVFTAALLEVWADGRFQKGHRELIAAIAALVDRDLQQPNLTFLAPLDETFATMRPFTW